VCGKVRETLYYEGEGLCGVKSEKTNM